MNVLLVFSLTLNLLMHFYLGAQLCRRVFRGVISDFSWGGGGGQRQFGKRSEPNQLGVGGACKPISRKFFYFELFYVLFEAT